MTRQAMLPLDQWPQADTNAWEAATATGGILDDGGYLLLLTLIAAYQYQAYRTLKLSAGPEIYLQQPLLALVAAQPSHA